MSDISEGDDISEGKLELLVEQMRAKWPEKKQPFQPPVIPSYSEWPLPAKVAAWGAAYRVAQPLISLCVKLIAGGVAVSILIVIAIIANAPKPMTMEYYHNGDHTIPLPTPTDSPRVVEATPTPVLRAELVPVPRASLVRLPKHHKVAEQ